MLDKLLNNSIIILEDSYKKELLKKIDKLINIKFISMNEFIKSYYFDYDEKSILYLIKNYNLKYEVALEYLKNLIYIEEKKYNNDKLNFLVKIKKELIDNNLLIFNDKFKDYIKNKKIVIYKYSLNKFEKYLLKNIDYELIDKDNNNYIPKIYEFDYIGDEVDFVAKKISELINNGVNINKIKLANIDDEYISIINKIFGFYNLRINKFKKSPIISTVIGKIFYENLDNGLDAIKAIEEFSNTDIYNKIVNICNKYAYLDNINDLKILISYDLYHTYIDEIKYTNMIEVVDFKNYDFEDDYVFILGFNQGIIPKIYKDEDYINDNIKLDYMDSTIEKNIKEKKDVIKSIKNIKNLIITYKLKNPFSSFYPSNLIEELGEVERVGNDYNISYSELSAKINLTSYLDDFIKFGSKNENLDLLSSNYDIPYNTYSHAFSGIDKNKIDNYIKSKKSFNLSYTAMDNYNRCSFRFYIDKILCLKKDTDNFGIILGNIYHYILEKAVKEDINVNYEVNKYISNNGLKLSNSDIFFINRSIKNIEYVIEILKKQNKFCNLKKIETEKFININKIDNINFVGFIDKIIYDTINDIKIGAIIDYKTYVKAPSLKYIDYGIGLQLPTYMYLAKYSFKDIKFAGFYLQNIVLDNKSNEEKEKSLRLIGFTNTNKNILKEFDSNYMESSVIDGIKTNKDGSFSSNSLRHMLSDNEIDDVINITEKKVDECINNILDAKFDINPKYDKNNIGCEFCSYKDLCFMKEYDYLKIKPNAKFGGDDDE